MHRKERKTMRAALKSIPLALDVPEGQIRQTEWGGMAVETGTLKGRLDPGAFFRGLPDDRCQCPHWGYVLKGTLRYKYADHEEAYQAGEAYYASPGHTPVLEPGLEYVEFSPAKELAETMKVVERNMSKASD
jgi:hypothetical protein